MSILKEISGALSSIGEIRRITKFVMEITDLKKQMAILKADRDDALKLAGKYKQAIIKHKKAMEDCPRSWESDKDLWSLLENNEG